MKFIRPARVPLFLLIILYPFMLAGAAAQMSPEAPDAWTVVASGIEYQKYHITNPRPVDIFVTRMDRSNQSVTIDSAIGQGRLSGGTEKVSGMAARYDQNINYWARTWGNRNRVVVAINGYFFGSPQEPSGVPWSGVVNSAWYSKRFTTNIGDAGFAWTLDRQAFIGKCVFHRAERNDISFIGASYDPNIDAINITRSDEELILYTPQYDATTKTLENGATPRAEILIELTRPSLVISDPSYVRGTIKGIYKNSGSTPIPFDHAVLAAWGNIGSALVSRINGGDIDVGDEVRITNEITDCVSDPQHDWTNVYASLGGDYHFLRAGAYYPPSNPDATVRNSRTVVGYSSSYVFFVVVDGFNANVSEGITLLSLSDWMEVTLGATDAVSLDSGTSSTMVVNGEVKNNTYCTYTRNCGMQNPTGTESQFQSSPPDSGEAVEISTASDNAYVGSGLMMVVVEPRAQSARFRSGQSLTALLQTSLRLGPGANYASLLTLNPGAQGIVITHLLDGVLATGSYWWKGTFGGSTGWVKEESMQGGQLPPPPGEVQALFPLILINP